MQCSITGKDVEPDHQGCLHWAGDESIAYTDSDGVTHVVNLQKYKCRFCDKTAPAGTLPKPCNQFIR